MHYILKTYTPPEWSTPYFKAGWEYIRTSRYYNGVLTCGYTRDIGDSKRYSALSQIRREANHLLTRPLKPFLKRILKIEIIPETEIQKVLS